MITILLMAALAKYRWIPQVLLWLIHAMAVIDLGTTRLGKYSTGPWRRLFRFLISLELVILFSVAFLQNQAVGLLLVLFCLAAQVTISGWCWVVESPSDRTARRTTTVAGTAATKMICLATSLFLVLLIYDLGRL